MNPYEMVIAIIFLVIAGKVLRSYLHNRGEANVGTDTAETLQLRDEMRALKERVQVLERVVTDNHNSLDLDREIARLRDR